ncbi:MAG TPA: hypothetical protein VF540_13475 [Segetibacter sp.]
MKQILLTPIVFALLILPCFAQQTQPLSDDDYAQVIKAILLDKRLNERTVLPKKERVVAYLSTENISQKLVPDKIKGVKIELKTPQQIKEEKKNWRNYLTFGKFETNGSTIIVNVDYYYREIDEQEFGEPASMEYEYHKVGSKWEMARKKPKATFKL